jgi:hypothetical protein
MAERDDHRYEGYVNANELNDEDDQSEDDSEDGYNAMDNADGEYADQIEETENDENHLEEQQRMVEARIDAMLQRQFRDDDFFFPNYAPQESTKDEETTNEETTIYDNDDDIAQQVESLTIAQDDSTIPEISQDIPISTESKEIITQTMQSLKLSAPSWATKYENEEDWMKFVLQKMQQ